MTGRPLNLGNYMTADTARSSSNSTLPADGGGAGRGCGCGVDRVVLAATSAREGADLRGGTLGKVGNCQVAVSVHAATDTASAPLDWRLYLPESLGDRRCDDWATAAAITARRRGNAIPDQERYHFTPRRHSPSRCSTN